MVQDGFGAAIFGVLGGFGASESSDKPENWDRNKAYIEKIKKQIKQDKEALKQETKEK